MSHYRKMNDDTIIEISEKVIIGENVTFGKQCKHIKLGYGTVLGNNIYIDVPILSVGDYTTIHRDTTIHGYKDCLIGHNCWIGQFCIIDTIGGTSIGNNVGVGAHSQLWSHIKFGDMLEGCNWNGSKPLIVEDDVWFVGHCIVSPIIAKSKSMLMVGSVATKNMEVNRIYSGSPAKDVSDKLGYQFHSVSLENKMIRFKELYNEFLLSKNLTEEEYPIVVRESINNDQSQKSDISTFFLNERLYIPTRKEMEYQFMKFLLYDKAKFIPIDND